MISLTSKKVILEHWQKRPDEICHPPASNDDLVEFEALFGPIPEDYRWFLSECGGGVVGAEWVDGIRDLKSSHQKVLKEPYRQDWKLGGNLFLIGWDGIGNPIGISRESGVVITEDHNSAELYELSPSIETFLARGIIDPH